MAVLFSDVRRSTEFAARVTPSELFERLNRLLSRQSRVVQAHGGSVLKYTGDGLMAGFRGLGRSYLAVRCGLALLADTAEADPSLPSGAGVCEGLVMAGFIGDAGRQQYDILGATVHMAARLCSLAEAGEVLATAQTARSARLRGRPTRNVGPIEVRGFDGAVACVAFTS